MGLLEVLTTLPTLVGKQKTTGYFAGGWLFILALVLVIIVLLSAFVAGVYQTTRGQKVKMTAPASTATLNQSPFLLPYSHPLQR